MNVDSKKIQKFYCFVSKPPNHELVYFTMV